MKSPLIDLHTHTWRCRHATGTVQEYVQAAASAGVDILGLTDHLPLPVELDPTVCYAMPVEEFGAHVEEMRAVAAESRRVKVCVGVEADWLPEHPGYVADLLSMGTFDFVLGSVHMIDGWAFDDPGLLYQWEGRDVLDVWNAYFHRLSAAAASGMFDVIAHPDLIKKFGHRPEREPIDLYDSIAHEFARSGVAVEVSSAGLRKPVGEIYPGPALLAALCRAGVPATMASDAHTPADVGFGLDLVRQALYDAGYTHVVYFRDREMVEVPL